MDINQVLRQDFVKAFIHNVCGEQTTLVKRDNSFAVRNTIEGDRDVHRVILLPPHGFTANAPEQMNSHDEADYATIEIKGAIREGKRGFSKLRDCLLVASRNETGAVSRLSQPYLTFDIESGVTDGLTLKKHSAGSSPFAVVRNDGFGFYHNLINLTDEWLALKLHKRLRPQKPVELERHLVALSKAEGTALRALHDAIVRYGDSIFTEAPDTVRRVQALPLERVLPALGEMLFVHDSGMHEACTVFAIILKLGKETPATVISYLETALRENAIPPYYAEQLIGKIERFDRTTRAAAASAGIRQYANT